MTTLFDLCGLIRSKNAGPFVLTFDLMFSDEEKYQRVKRSAPIDSMLMARLYGVAPESIAVVYHDGAKAIKISMPRPVFQCDLGDSDCYGGQQYVPLLSIPVQEAEAR